MRILKGPSPEHPATPPTSCGQFCSNGTWPRGLLGRLELGKKELGEGGSTYTAVRESLSMLAALRSFTLLSITLPRLLYKLV